MNHSRLAIANMSKLQPMGFMHPKIPVDVALISSQMEGSTTVLKGWISPTKDRVQRRKNLAITNCLLDKVEN